MPKYTFVIRLLIEILHSPVLISARCYLVNTMTMLENIRIVLVGTTHSGNIGSAARAMKVMGLSNMVLVAPACDVDGQAIALAAGASDIANNARVVSCVEEAIADCALVVGTSSRSRSLDWPMLDARECGQKAVEHAADAPVAILFGRERTGLTNQELQACHYHVAIPANPDYCSLNLAMAVQILSYEMRMAALNMAEQPKAATIRTQYPTSDELERFYIHLEQTLYQTGFIKQAHPGLVMTKLRRLFNRARPESQELNILRGVLSSMIKTSDKTPTS